MNDHITNVMSIAKANVCPRFACVGGLVHSVSMRNVAANAGLPGAGINYIGIGIRNGDRANRGDGLFFEKRIPGITSIRGFPNATGHCAEVIGVRLRWNASNCNYAAAPERPNARRHARPTLKKVLGSTCCAVPNTNGTTSAHRIAANKSKVLREVFTPASTRKPEEGIMPSIKSKADRWLFVDNNLVVWKGMGPRTPLREVPAHRSYINCFG